MRYRHTIIILLLFFALLPYFVISFYAFPFADDFCFGWTAAQKISFTQKFLKQYLGWNGRYSTDVLVQFHPLLTGKIFFYHLFCLVMVTGSVIVHFILFRAFVQSVKFVFMGSLLFSLFFFYRMPNISEHFYWFIGSVNYLLPQLCISLHLVLLIKVLKQKKNSMRSLIGSAVLLIVAIGFNEITALLMPLFYLVAAVISFKQRLGSKNIFAGFFVLAFMASVFVIFSPGNFGRASNFSNNMNVLHSTFYASMQTIRFIGLWSLNAPFIIFTLVVAAYSYEIRLYAVDDLDFRLTAILLIGSVFTGSFLPYFATGILGQHHTLNFVFYFFLVLWIVFVVGFSKRFSLHQKLERIKNEKTLHALLGLSTSLMMVTGNGYHILKDVTTNKFSLYKAEFTARQKNIIEHPYQTIPSIKNVPCTLEITDAKADSTYWVDKCMKFYYAETYANL